MMIMFTTRTLKHLYNEGNPEENMSDFLTHILICVDSLTFTVIMTYELLPCVCSSQYPYTLHCIA